MNITKSIRFGRLGPVLLFVVAILAFGLLIPWLGYYWDDWAKILVSRLYGLSGYFDYYAEDRILSAWTHIIFTPLVGSSPTAWQVFGMLLRWLSSWAMLWSLNILWPRARQHNMIAALAFLVYPVFVQQPIALTFHQQWLQYALVFLSFGAMLKAYKAAQRRSFGLWTGLAVAASGLQLTVSEYFISLELVRPFLLWYLLEGSQVGNAGRPAFTGRARTFLRSWSPYLLLLAGYTIFRLFFQRFPGEDPYRANTLFQFFSAPVETVKTLAFVILADVLHILIFCWDTLGMINLHELPPATLFSYAAGITAGAMAGVYLYLASRKEQPGVEPWVRQALIIGLAGVIFGPIPAWITGRQVVFDFHSNRYAMPAMFGAALLFSAMIGWLSKGPAQRAFLAAALVSIAVALNVRVANEFRWAWTDQLRTYWQLSWRAPGLKPGTALLFETEPFPDQGLFSTSAAINLLYPQEKKIDPANLDLDYWVYTLRPRYNNAPDNPVVSLNTRFRTLFFKGSTPNSLLIYKQPGQCLWVLSPEDALHPKLPGVVLAWLEQSSLNQIIPVGEGIAKPPAELFGEEPPHEWCYYYQKASLAVQLQDWPSAAGLADQVLDMGYGPVNPVSGLPYEWFPFIRGLAGVGRWDQSADLTREIYEVDRGYAPMLCDLWENRAPFLGSQGGEGSRQAVRQALACGQGRD